MTTAEAQARLEGVPCGPVNDVLGALEDPQAAAREVVASYEHPRLGAVRVTAAPYRLGTVYSRAPGRGEHTEALLRDLCGYDDARLDRARSEGAFG
jgi:crotonobetainyl-CoA:carnitine CoA-transferase CaiB-like acyl-CoA transferase